MEPCIQDRYQLAQSRHHDWWLGKGCALWVTSPADEPWLEVPEPLPPADLERRWLDPGFRVQQSLHWLSRTYHGGAAFPYVDTMIGPGSLGLFLGCEPEFGETTVWYKPCFEDPDTLAPVRFDSENSWWKAHLALIEEALCVSQSLGGWLPVGIPDLIENWDTLAQLRDPMELLMDAIDRPEWVLSQIDAINEAFFETFDLIFDRIKTPVAAPQSTKGEGPRSKPNPPSAICNPQSAVRNPQSLSPNPQSEIPNPQFGCVFAAFSLWGPGKTAKVQCDAASMLSPEHFKRFVRPALTRQCEWLDYSMFHLDGTTCFPVLDALLEIEPLKAVEFTPQPQLPGGGSPEWYGLYRRIRQAGKSVQAIWVKPEEVLPLLDALGPEGMYLMVECQSEAEAKRLEREVYG